MSTAEQLPGTSVQTGAAPDQRPDGQPPAEHLTVSEIVSDRPAAPSPFGDDQTFPLPVEELRYTPTTAP